MIPVELLAFLFAIGAGAFGALVGIGGGLIVVPLLTIVLGVDIKLAIAASLLGVIAVSTSAAATYLNRGLVDRRLGLVLLLATAIGGILGGYVAGLLNARTLTAIFGVVLVAVAIQMLRGRGQPAPDLPEIPGRFDLDSSYVEPTTGKQVVYRARRLGPGAAISVVAGSVSGLLGVGGGVINVPTMNLLMGVPIRVATTTSTYMLGATAAASAVMYYSRGQIDPLLAGPVVVGVVLGAQLGARLAARVSQHALQLIFVGVALFFALQMLLRAASGA
ncbi:MAG TPA: sulfite exporter TauE/SafE family protein [Candidatus Caenarcaniphilales bacterium]|nr:sulfite exporter TauE/SafE family protein [Candidatus Caenarcaniphilales bacterium]